MRHLTVTCFLKTKRRTTFALQYFRFFFTRNDITGSLSVNLTASFLQRFVRTILWNVKFQYVPKERYSFWPRYHLNFLRITSSELPTVVIREHDKQDAKYQEDDQGHNGTK
jgi:hypothetical protein